MKQSVHSDSLDVRHSKTLFLRLPNNWSISPHERESGLWNRKIFGFRSFEIQDIWVKESATCGLREHPVFSAQVSSFTRRENRLRKRAQKKSAETRNLSRKNRKLSAVSLKIGIRGVESRIQNCLGFLPYMGRDDKPIFATEEMNLQCSDSFKITCKMISTKIDALSCLDFLAVHVCVIMWYCVSVSRARSKQPFCLSFLLIEFLSYPTGRLADGKIEKKENSYWTVDVLLYT